MSHRQTSLVTSTHWCGILLETLSGTVVEWHARSAGVPMVTGSNSCEGKDLFLGPRESLSPPSSEWVPNISQGNKGGCVMRGTLIAEACERCITCKQTGMVCGRINLLYRRSACIDKTRQVFKLNLHFFVTYYIMNKYN